MFATLLQVATPLVAVYGAILATYNTVAAWNSKRRRLKVDLSHGFIAQGGQHKLLIAVSNPGQVPVTLTGVRLPMPTGHNIVIHDDGLYEHRLPFEILPGRRTLIHPDLVDIQDSIRNLGHSSPFMLQAIAEDGEGREFASRALKVDLS